MKLKDLKIGTHLRIGMGAILLFVAVLGATAWFLAEDLWEETKGLYEHPLTVRRSIDQITIDIVSMHRDMKDLVLAENEQERQAIVQSIDIREADAGRQFDILYDRYLGPKSDIDKARDAFVEWKSIRNTTIRMLRDGKTAAAARRTKPGGVGGGHVEKLMKEIKDISNFAKNRGDQYYQDAKKHRDELIMRLKMVLAAILLLTLGITYFLLKNIKEPLQELTSAAEQFRLGKLNARSQYVSTNEFGILAAAFNALADTIQTEWQAKESTLRISASMLKEEELRPFCRALLQGLLEHTGSQIGAVYLLNEEETAFDHYESIGLAPGGRPSFSANGLEGEFGAALATGQIQRLTDIPMDTPFTFATVGGDFRPREVITIPIPVDGGIGAVISLAGIRSYPDPAVRLVNDVWHTITARLNGVLASGKIRTFAERLERQNYELQAQQEELEAQAEELRKQTEELLEQNMELEQQRLAVEEASRLKSQFLSNMSHELRTPLNSVMALSRVLMMQARTKLSAEEVNYLEIIERNGKKLLALINDILDLSKIEAGRMDISPKLFSLRLLLENIVESISPLAGEKDIELRQEIPGDLPAIESDEIRVSQILQNLLANAVKFTDAGRVTVSVEGDKEKVCIRVSDTGIGIAAGDLPYIFDEFRQVDGTSSRRYEGTGLGLAIARKASRMLGGDIAVASTLGKGSTFTLTLPVLWQGQAAVYEPTVSTQPPRLESERKTILVVDDEPEMAATLSRYLRQEGYNTLTATSGMEALTLAAQERPFAITLDIIMPDMDGWEVLQNLKKNSDTKDIPVIIISISEDRTTGFALGAVGYVTKPVDRKELLAKIKRMLQDLESHPQQPGADKQVALPRILLVEDNEAAIIQVKAVLEGAGYCVDVARGGQEAMDYVTHTIPDGIVLDLMMPGIDGFEVLEKIRGTQATTDIPVLILTAKDLTHNDFKRLTANNIQQLVQKGDVDRENLLFKVSSMLGTRSGKQARLYEGAATVASRPLPGVADHHEHVKSRSTSYAKETGNPRKVRVAGTPQAAARVAETAEMTEIGKIPVILVVEDNPDNMTTIKAVLQHRYGILEATDGEEGLQMAAAERPDLILLDMALPKLDGFTVVRRIKDSRELNHIPVIAMTAKVMKGDREKILAAGCEDYIAKPIDPEDFLKRIGAWLKE
jgi:CheY-like chemotaxis protein/signal transduction histidine kinase/HAMP domain-containing protein